MLRRPPGLCVEPPLIVTEYYPRGSLFELLRKVTRIDSPATHCSTEQSSARFSYRRASSCLVISISYYSVTAHPASTWHPRPPAATPRPSARCPGGSAWR